MNWRRGLFRVWITASVIWMLATIIIAYRAEANLPPLPPGYVLDSKFHTTWFWLGEFLGPPAISGVLLVLLMWIFAGFQSN